MILFFKPVKGTFLKTLADSNRLSIALFLLLSLFCQQQASGQRFYSVLFNKLPQDYQLYPRNDKNEALVPVKGIIELAGYSHMGVQVLRNNTLVKYLKAEIKYDSKGIGAFSTEYTIKAELAGYNFNVYACKTNDSTLIAARKSVVSGDVYVIMGQSNSTGFFNESETSEFCRSFGQITGNLNTEPYNPADTLWGLSNQPQRANVGTMGLELQKQLSQASGIPNCLINAGFHWSTASGHANRNASNPADLSTAYGRMLFRLQKSGMLASAKTFIYRQGETEAYNEGFGWEENFKKFRDNLKTDLPALEKIYVFQIDIIYYPSLVGATLRDYQRRLPAIYPEIRNLATVGTKQFDGLHYGPEGNKQGGLELSRLIARDFYDSKDTLNINSPNIRKVFYKTPEKKELVLVFDQGQQLVYPAEYKPNGNVTLNMNDFFYLDDAAGSVASGTAQENRVVLTLKTAQSASRLNYLPPYLQEGGSYYPFNGPFITNKLGMRAFTFYQVAIAAGLDIPVLTANFQDSKVTLTWNEVKDATGYILQRKQESETNWKTVATLPASSALFTDTPPVESSNKFNYRVTAVGNLAESGDFGYADVTTGVVTGLENKRETEFSVFPNPAKPTDHVTIRFKNPVTGLVSVFDNSGRKVGQTAIKRSTEKQIALKYVQAGYYFFRFESGANQRTSKVLFAP